MPKRMLIDAAHPEETRVVVLNGTRLEEFDFESSTKKQVKGNIYLAKVTRVEPSLQAAFVEYGGNRHGFLAFSEIHPDYYRIPVGDRDGEVELGFGAEEAPALVGDGADDVVPIAAALPEPVSLPHRSDDDETVEEEEAAVESASPEPEDHADHSAGHDEPDQSPAVAEFSPEPAGAWVEPPPEHDRAIVETAEAIGESLGERVAEPDAIALAAAEQSVISVEASEIDETPRERTPSASGESVETLGGDEIEEAEDERVRSRTRSLRHYKIQEVIKRRQIMLVQVAKEERGNKGAALTTYLSLAGRYCVLMPNTGRGGGVSRKITSISDRRRLKDILEDLEIPDGMGVIVRTAGSERSKAEVKRDYEYLLRLWNEIRELTLKSTAPALIYEEGNLIKRSIRDLYTRDLEEVLVEGEEGYKTAKAFMRTLMPSHAKRVQPYRDPQSGLFHKFQVESQIDAIHSPVVQLRSGGYVVINQTEALVAIDVNSGRSTRERNIEETALRTNLEAAEELARQLRLRDLAGLIVIDFIDMEEHRNQVAVERRLKEALKNDRARIQVGRISPFGLLEMSRQRLRPSLAEASTQPCPHCGGTGFIRSVESTALYVLRAIEEEGIRRRTAEICIYVPTGVALYMLNQKRESLTQIEVRYGVSVMVARDDSLVPPAFRLERLRSYGAGEVPVAPRSIQAPTVPDGEDEDEDADDEVEIAEERGAPGEIGGEAGEIAGESEEERGRRRRRRRRRRPDEGRAGRRPREAATEAAAENGAATVESEPQAAGDGEREAAGESDAEGERRRRRRGRRGGRWRGKREDGDVRPNGELPAAETIEIMSASEDDAIAAETASAPSLEVWPGDTGIEAASLAPLAGDVPAAPPGAAEPEAETVAAPTAEAEPGIPYVSQRERVFEEIAASPSAPAHRSRDEPEPEPEDRHQPLREPEPLHMPEPEPAETAAAPRERSLADEYVQTVTEKPANPRKGWWQRLTQP